MQRDDLMRSLAVAHGDILLNLARRLTRSEADAKDLVQDVFERALNSFDQIRDPARGRAWLVSILHNIFLDRCRKRRLLAEVLGDANLEVLRDPAAANEVPEEPPWADLTHEDLSRALEHLEPTFRQVFELREFARCSYQEIARRLGLPLRTAGTRLHRARARLRELLIRSGPKHEQAL